MFGLRKGEWRFAKLVMLSVMLGTCCMCGVFARGPTTASSAVIPTATLTARPTWPPTWTPTVRVEPAATTTRQAKAPTPVPKVDRIEAVVMCHYFVEDRLVAPGTVRWGGGGWFPTPAEVVCSGRQCTVCGFFDAENRLGALLRADYCCTLTWLSETDTWRLDAINIVER